VETDSAENAERISRRLEVSRLFSVYGNVQLPTRARARARAGFCSFELISSDVATLILRKAPIERPFPPFSGQLVPSAITNVFPHKDTQPYFHPSRGNLVASATK